MGRSYLLIHLLMIFQDDRSKTDSLLTQCAYLGFLNEPSYLIIFPLKLTSMILNPAVDLADVNKFFSITLVKKLNLLH